MVSASFVSLCECADADRPTVYVAGVRTGLGFWKRRNTLTPNNPCRVPVRHDGAIGLRKRTFFTGSGAIGQNSAPLQ